MSLFNFMALLDPNASDIDNLQRASFLSKRVETGVAIAEQALSRLHSDYSMSSSNGTERTAQICDLVTKIKYCEKIANAFSSMITGINEIFSWLVTKINYAVAKYLIKTYQIILLRIKKLATAIKLFVANATRTILSSCMTGVGSAAAAALLMPLQALLLVFQGIANVTGAILQGVQTMLSMIPAPACVPAEGACLFMTPKSMKKTDITIANPNQSVTDRLSPMLKKGVLAILETTKKANIPVKAATIAAGAAIGTSLMMQGKVLEIPDSACTALSFLDPKKMAELLNTLIAYIPFADPLPKYENLSIINPGFLVWLLTGFLPAAKLSFGIPGMP